MAEGEPTAFGRYTLLAKLGRGGMAEIFLARSVGAHGFERQFVIKRMHAHLSSDARFTDMFIREARLSARLVHANIVPVFDFGDADGHLYLAMEYVDGVDLRPILKGLRKRNDPVPVEVACFVAIEILRGLDYAHRQADSEGTFLGIVHRDISPSNILVSREGEVKVCDFGIALVATDHMTAAGTLKGKFAYMSPEQARGLRVDRRSDVFGVALVLWEMLAARRLYVAPDEVQTLILAQHARHPPPPVDHAPHGEVLGGVLLRALAVNPKDRYSSAAAFADDLQQYLAHVGLVGSSRRLATFLRDRCAVELKRRDLRVVGEGTHTAGATPSTSGPSTFTSLPALPEDWADEMPEEALDLGEPEEGSSLAPPALVLPAAAPVEAPRARPPRPAPPVAPPVPPPQAVIDSGRWKEVPLLRKLIERGLITTDQAEVVVGHATRWACRMVSAILAHRFLSESELCHVLADLHALPTVDLSTLEISPDVFRRIPRAVAERVEAVPFALEMTDRRNVLSIAIAASEALGAHADLEFAAGTTVRAHVARYSAVTGMLRRLYGGEDTPVPPLAPPGVPEQQEEAAEAEMVIERFGGESIVNTAVDGPLELNDSAPKRFRR